MSGRQAFEADGAGAVLQEGAGDGELLRQLVQAPKRGEPFVGGGAGVAVGELVALADDGKTPLVIDPSAPQAPALRARTVVDLHESHIGRQLVLMFEQGDTSKPIVMGVLRAEAERELPTMAQGCTTTELVADGERLLVGAKQQLVLRCGKSSITLTKAGKVLIEGAYVLSRSTGVNRIKGGSVQLN